MCTDKPLELKLHVLWKLIFYFLRWDQVELRTEWIRGIINSNHQRRTLRSHGINFLTLSQIRNLISFLKTKIWSFIFKFVFLASSRSPLKWAVTSSFLLGLLVTRKKNLSRKTCISCLWKCGWIYLFFINPYKYPYVFMPMKAYIFDTA